MNKTLLLALSALLIIPASASAATATADVKTRNGVEVGPVAFKAAKGERNEVTVTNDLGRIRFHDDANRVRARGDCKQVNRHTALCPASEDPAQVRLGNRGDSATVEGLVQAFGGGGNDVLRGSSGVDVLSGERGNDTLHGLGNFDTLTGGPGRDRVFGGAGDDELVDGETDKQSARDLYRGGSSRDTKFQADRGDRIDYSMRSRSLKIDLGRGKANTGDRILGLESILGGSAADTLAGDGDDNWIDGNGGNDRIRGRAGDDLVRGSRGNDRVSGEAGNDYVSGEGGTDVLSGGAGDDQVTSTDSNAETVDCGEGDDTAPTTRIDTLVACEKASSQRLMVQVQPTAVTGNKATFGVACLSERGCSGTLTLTGANGEAYGSGTYTDLPHGADLFTPVEVELTNEGKQALKDGALVVMSWGSGSGGFRAAIEAN